MNELVIGRLNYLVKTYKSLTKLVTSTKQRLVSLPGEDLDEDFDPLLRGEKNTVGLETIKNSLTRQIEKELFNWELWEMWLKHVPGIGGGIAGELIILYYYKFLPTCKECGGDLDREDGGMVCSGCGKQAKDGLLRYRTVERDFPTISKWWAFMGRHTVDGVMPKRAKGIVSNWSTPGRTLGFQIGDQFNRRDPDNPYKAFMVSRKEKHARNHPDWKKGHIHNAARNETVKLFLAHLWTVARTLDGKPVSEPYAGTIMGHTGIIKPFFWEDGQ